MNENSALLGMQLFYPEDFTLSNVNSGNSRTL